MADRRKILTVAGLSLLGVGAVLAGQSGAPAPKPAGSPPPPAPGAPHSCVLAHGRTDKIVVMSRFYNWSDLRVLPLNPGDPQDWNHGGTFAAIGIGIGYTLPWTEAKVGTANDGTSGWFLRISSRTYAPGDWAVPAVALGIATPCA